MRAHKELSGCEQPPRNSPQCRRKGFVISAACLLPGGAAGARAAGADPRTKAGAVPRSPGTASSGSGDRGVAMQGDF